MRERCLGALLVQDDAADEDDKHHDRKHNEGTIHGYSFRPDLSRNEVVHHSTLPKSETDGHPPYTHQITQPDTTGLMPNYNSAPRTLGNQHRR